MPACGCPEDGETYQTKQVVVKYVGNVGKPHRLRAEPQGRLAVLITPCTNRALQVSRSQNHRLGVRRLRSARQADIGKQLLCPSREMVAKNVHRKRLPLARSMKVSKSPGWWLGDTVQHATELC